MKIFRLVLVLVMVMSLNSGLYPGYFFNDVPPGFPYPVRAEIDNMMTTGASDFLSSYGEAMLMLKEFEVYPESNYNLENALVHVEAASKKLESARQKFFDAWTTGVKSPYESMNKKKFIDFDYDGTIKAEKLNSIIAGEAAFYLKKCDISGLYKKNLDRIDEIGELLKTIRTGMYGNVKPEAPTCWKLLQKFSETLLFGNYATVFAQKALNN